MWYDMINEWKNAIMILETFDWGVCSVSLPLLYFWALSTKRHFHLRWKRSYILWSFASESALRSYMPWKKGKQKLEPLDGLSLNHKTRTGERSIKGPVYPSAYCSITATTIKSNLSNTVWFMMKLRLRPDLFFLFFFP